MSRIFCRRDVGGDNVALVAGNSTVRWRRMQVVGVGAHAWMLRVCVSFEISGRPAARIGTMAAIASQTGRLDLTIDVQLFVNEFAILIDDRTVALKAFGILWMRCGRRQSVAAATSCRRISRGLPNGTIARRIELMTVRVATRGIRGVVRRTRVLSFCHIDRKITEGNFGALGVIEVTRRKYPVGNSMAFSAPYWLMTGTLSQMVLVGPYPTRA